MTGDYLAFVPQFNNNFYAFQCRDSVSNLTTPLTIDSTNTTIANNLISNSQATFNNICPISNTNATLTNHLTTLGFNDGKYMSLTVSQTKSGTVNFLNQITFNGGSGGGTAIVCNNGLYANTTLYVSGQATFNANVFSNATTNVKNINWIDVQSPFTNKIECYLNNDALIFTPLFNLNRYAFITKDSGGSPINALLISNASTTIGNNLVSNNLTAPTSTSVNNIYRTLVSGGEINFGSTLSANYIFGQTTFNSASIFNLGCSFLGSLSFNNGGTFSEIEQTSGSQLVIRNTTNSKDIILSTTSASTGQVDSLKINTTSCDILSPTLNLTSSSTINILTPNNLTGVINFLSTLTTATVNFCSTAYTSIFNLNARLAHKQVQYMNEVKIISGTSLTLAFPLEQRWQFTSTGATQIVIDLPQLTATSQTGFYFSFYKTASNTNSVKFNRQGTNVIRPLNSITDLTTITVISGTSVTGAFLTAELSSGNFAWIYI